MAIELPDKIVYEKSDTSIHVEAYMDRGIVEIQDSRTEEILLSMTLAKAEEIAGSLAMKCQWIRQQ